MAIYHLTTKAVSRSKGQSSIASAAYRSGEKLENEKTGEVADYWRKTDVDYKEIIGFDGSRSELWNQAEKAEKRKDATVAKEYEVSLPKELNREQKIDLVKAYGNYLHERHKVAADICIHKIDSDNPHAHILTTTREINNGNELGGKATREWSDTKRKQYGLEGRKQDLVEAREKWALYANQALERAQVKSRIDSRSLKAQGIDRSPQIHVGPTATAMERKGKQTDRGDVNRDRMDLDKLKTQFNQVHTQRKKLLVKDGLKRGHAEKVKSIPDSLPELEAFKQKEIAINHNFDALRVKRARERLDNLTKKAVVRSRDLRESKPVEPQGVLKRFKKSGYDNDLKYWQGQALASDKRLNQLSVRKQALQRWYDKTKAEVIKRIEQHFPELGIKQRQMEVKRDARRAEIKREFANKRKPKAKTKGFER